MITDEEFRSLGYIVKTNTEGASPVETVQVELIWAILKELRANRKMTQQLAKHFEQVTAGGQVMLTEAVLR